MTASINRQEALHQFKLALKAGQKCYRDCVHRGRAPYPQVLEELLQGGVVAGRVDLGELEIPIAQIVGMNTAGRQTAFAADGVRVRRNFRHARAAAVLRRPGCAGLL